ncbi:hydantoinase/oxoprolinase family protein [Halobaculum roseum]|uniref:Hydantoinase/oxoprolinase family protein n=1 Tax=Halobaculum roseum TaxID=2175149 RepID=A0ABD5MJF5_9EURY|nr:hydantoinase/oxoprolinase family protein [Halobaculum roseum]QZY01914.1 hydantoinase/oxoprolinase family protein [Halobaculum roseum]
MPYQIGTDIGGTHTDTVVLSSDGERYLAKAPSTPDDFSVGVIESLKVAADEIGITLDELVDNTERFINASTVATNTIAELQGAKTGLITTKGFEDTLRIARSPRKIREYDPHKQTGVPEVVDRECIEGLAERMDYDGNVVVSLDRDEAEAAVDRLVDKDVDTIAVSFLWSFENDAHEKIIGEIIEEKYPEMHYSLSHEIFPVIREYERTVTTVFNSYAGPSVVKYVENLSERLENHGLDSKPLIMHSEGGYSTPEEAKENPVTLVNSGPAAGVTGANELGKQLGVKNILTADMGGTSFDTSMIYDNEIQMRNRAKIGDFDTGLDIVDVEAIGSGGGSIGWIDDRGQPQVGPESAGADPGPACYGKGGTEPTITDAALTLGYLNPDYFLAGRDSLDEDAALEAIETHLADPLGYDTTEAASAMMNLAIAKMSNAARAVSVERGYDPREFAMLAYGGTSPLFAPMICGDMNIDHIIIPDEAASFSARGLLSADHKRSYFRTHHTVLDEDSVVDISGIYEDMEAKARKDFEDEGVETENLIMNRRLDLRFSGQAEEYPLNVEQRGFEPEDASRIEERFIEDYERRYGSGTAWIESDVEIQNLRVEATAPVPTLETSGDDGVRADGGADPADALKHHREVYVLEEDGYRELPIYDGRALSAGFELDEPAIIERPYTTVYVPPGASLSVDEHEHTHVHLGAN